MVQEEEGEEEKRKSRCMAMTDKRRPRLYMYSEEGSCSQALKQQLFNSIFFFF